MGYLIFLLFASGFPPLANAGATLVIFAYMIPCSFCKRFIAIHLAE